jgi:hypothetical protein
VIEKKRSKPPPEEKVVDLDERRDLRTLAQGAHAKLAPVVSAQERFADNAKSRGTPLPDQYDLTRLKLAYFATGAVDAAKIVGVLTLVLHGSADQKKLLPKVAVACELAAGLRSRRRGRQMVDREALNYELCRNPPQGETIEEKVSAILAAIRNVLGPQYQATVEDVKRRKGVDDWPSLIRAAYRACGLPPPGHAKIVKNARAQRAKRRSNKSAL